VHVYKLHLLTYLLIYWLLIDSCFFSLLLVAFIVWKLKQRYNLYRRGQVTGILSQL